MEAKKDIKALREEAFDYMYKMSQIEWTPKETLDFTDITKTLKYEKGIKYHGVLYNTYFGLDSPITMTNLEMFKTSLDENNVYVGTTVRSEACGNHCTSAVILSWQHIGDKTTARWSRNMLPTSGTGICAIGYKFEPEDDTTLKMKERNTEEEIYECYAKATRADAIINVWDKAGHCRMLDTVVTVRENGKINPEKSYVKCLEQTWSWDPQLDFEKCGYMTTWFVGHEYSFKTLYEKNFLPITVKSLID